MVYTTSNNRGPYVVTFVSKLYIFIIYLYYRPFLPQTGNTSERPVCLLIEAFVLDLQQRNIRWAFTGRQAFTGRKPLATVVVVDQFTPMYLFTPTLSFRKGLLFFIEKMLTKT